jgi:hypothetical protein
MIFNKQLADGNGIYSRCQILFVWELDFTRVGAGVQPFRESPCPNEVVLRLITRRWSAYK